MPIADVVETRDIPWPGYTREPDWSSKALKIVRKSEFANQDAEQYNPEHKSTYEYTYPRQPGEPRQQAYREYLNLFKQRFDMVFLRRLGTSSPLRNFMRCARKRRRYALVNGLPPGRIAPATAGMGRRVFAREPAIWGCKLRGMLVEGAGRGTAVYGVGVLDVAYRGRRAFERGVTETHGGDACRS